MIRFVAMSGVDVKFTFRTFTVIMMGITKRSFNAKRMRAVLAPEDRRILNRRSTATSGGQPDVGSCRPSPTPEGSRGMGIGPGYRARGSRTSVDFRALGGGRRPVGDLHGVLNGGRVRRLSGSSFSHPTCQDLRRNRLLEADPSEGAESKGATLPWKSNAVCPKIDGFRHGQQTRRFLSSSSSWCAFGDGARALDAMEEARAGHRVPEQHGPLRSFSHARPARRRTPCTCCCSPHGHRPAQNWPRRTVSILRDDNIPRANLPSGSSCSNSRSSRSSRSNSSRSSRSSRSSNKSRTRRRRWSDIILLPRRWFCRKVNVVFVGTIVGAVGVVIVVVVVVVAHGSVVPGRSPVVYHQVHRHQARRRRRGRAKCRRHWDRR
jgi:hypothetical protein